MRVSQEASRALGALAGLAMAAGAAAEPIAAGVTIGNSFTQHWFQPGVGDYNAIALEFVSQTPPQSSFQSVSVFAGASPYNGAWSIIGGDLSKTFAMGPIGTGFSFDLGFEGDTSDELRWNIWYYGPDGTAVRGFQYQGFGTQVGYDFVNLNPANAPTLIPLPPAVWAGMAGLGMVTCSRRLRRAG